MGNWLVDKVMFIAKYPSPGNLITIERIETGLGGCSHNVLVDLAKLEADLPLCAGGCIGDDDNGDFVMCEIEKHHIAPTYMERIKGGITSYTDVMSVKDGSSRTFFHYRGTNALLSPKHFEKVDVPCKIFHLGYLLLLDALDGPDPEYGIVAARVLHGLQQKGYLTSVDVVSEEGDRFREVVLPCLPYIDYFVVNEVEAGACYSKSLRTPSGEIDLGMVEEAAEFLMGQGVNKCCAIHFPEGGFALDKAGNRCFRPSMKLDAGSIVSTVGAGDAFCAGMLYAFHEEMPLGKALTFANTCALFNLGHATCTGGAPKLSEINDFIEKTYN